MKQTFGSFGKNLLAAGSLLAAVSSVQAESLKIGIAGPVTGPVAQYGDMQKIGAMMAIRQINEAGGINGQTLEGIIYDDACDPKQAVAVANRIVNDDIRHVIGPPLLQFNRTGLGYLRGRGRIDDHRPHPLLPPLPKRDMS